MGVDLCNKFFQICLDIRAFNGVMKLSGKSTQLAVFFNKNDFKTLFAQIKRGIHSGNTASNDQGLLGYGDHLLIQGA